MGNCIAAQGLSASWSCVAVSTDLIPAAIPAKKHLDLIRCPFWARNFSQRHSSGEGRKRSLC